MTRDELVVAIDPANRTATSKASRAGRSNDPGETGNHDPPLARPGPLTDVTSGAGAFVATVLLP